MIDGDVMADIEGDAEHLLRRAGVADDAPPNVTALCRAIVGVAPEFAPLRGEAEMAVVLGRPRIFVRKGTSPTRARWLACHELAEWWYASIGYVGADVEARCNALGAALVAPRRAVRSALAAVGRSPRALAKALGTTQSLAFLRTHEITREPGALVRDKGVIVRGAEFVWPALDLERARRLRHAAVRKAKITDEPARVGLVASALEAALPALPDGRDVERLGLLLRAQLGQSPRLLRDPLLVEAQAVPPEVIAGVLVGLQRQRSHGGARPL